MLPVDASLDITLQVTLTVITGIGAQVLAEFLNVPAIAFLYGSLVVVTGPTVINPLLKQVKVDRWFATLLEGEDVLIDPVGTFRQWLSSIFC